MKKDVRLFNLILPIWLLVLAPKILVFVIPGNLLVDCLVLFCTLCGLKHPKKGAVVRELWWKLWLLGFAADAVGVLWMICGLLLCLPFENLLHKSLSHISHNAFVHPAAFLWTLAGVAVAGVCIYCFDKRAMRKCALLSDREKRVAALTMAVVTAPWLFFIPIY